MVMEVEEHMSCNLDIGVKMINNDNNEMNGLLLYIFPLHYVTEVD